MEYYLDDAAATEKLGALLASHCRPPCVIYLHGELGAGKTTLVRSFLQAAGHSGTVKSPTYTLVEPYDLALGQIYHFDLYRLSSAEELEYMGGRDYFSDTAICLVEWAERGEGWLPQADLDIYLSYRPPGRQLRLLGHRQKGKELVAAVERELAC